MPRTSHRRIAEPAEILLGCAFGLMAACSDADPVPPEWIGRSATELVQVWGQPSEETSGPADGTILYISYWQDGPWEARQCRQTFALDASRIIVGHTRSGC